MAKREQRTWAQWLTGTVSCGPAAGPMSIRLIEDDGQAIGQGRVALCRLIGCVNVCLVNRTIGDPNLHIWHGVVNSNFDTADTSMFPVPGGNDANDEAWLWREPISLFPDGFDEHDSIDDRIISIRFDWHIRGGKGSVCRAETKINYVLECAGMNIGVLANMRALGLFTST